MAIIRSVFSNVSKSKRFQAHHKPPVTKAYAIWTSTYNPQVPTNNLHIHLYVNQLDPFIKIQASPKKVQLHTINKYV